MRQRFCLLMLISLAAPVQAAEQPAAKDVEFFEKKIRPVLAEQCYSCHSAEAEKNKKLGGALRLDTRDGVRTGGKSGPAILPGDAKKSLLLRALRHEGPKMPANKAKLTDAVVADFAQWIAAGAADPRDGSPLVAKRFIDLDAGRKNWAFRPLVSVTPPTLKQPNLASQPIDRFLLAKLSEQGLSYNPPLSREKLVRRASFDLTGLPPTPDEIDAARNDKSTDWYERLVDRLLQSERYGERWARHWLDLVRFAESGGYEFDKDRPGAYYYRDFVIRALNADMPYDEFVRLQIAGDRLKPGDLQATAATGFLVAGPYPGQTTAKTLEPIRYDHLDDMVSTLGTSLLGLSIGCARCHEHKYDPIPQQDYYHLLACLSRTDSTEAKIVGEHDPVAFGKAKAEYDREHAPLVKAQEKFEKEELPGRLRKWLETQKATPPAKTAAPLKTLLEKTPGPLPGMDLATAVRLFRPLDAETNKVYLAVETHAKKEPKPNQLNVFAAMSGRGGDVHYLIRGETARKNGVARPGFVQVLTNAPDGEKRWLPAADDPRIALAKWATDTEGGAGHLLARVIVNRLWQHHFGRGLVRTPNDFGVQGDAPTHPELLDYLAGELIRGGWKLKPIHRLIMTSAAYAQAGAIHDAGMKADPQNRLWWRVPPRRLEAESIRDAFLAASGTLDLKMYGPGSLDETGPRRSVYLTVKRSRLLPMMQAFDAPEPVQSVGERLATTAASQSLALMNSPFVRQRAEKLALRVRPKDEADLPRAIEEAYRLTLGRRPTDGERERIVRFVRSQVSAGAGPKALDTALVDCCQVLLCLNEFVFVD